MYKHEDKAPYLLYRQFSKGKSLKNGLYSLNTHTVGGRSRCMVHIVAVFFFFFLLLGNVAPFEALYRPLYILTHL